MSTAWDQNRCWRRKTKNGQHRKSYICKAATGHSVDCGCGDSRLAWRWAESAASSLGWRRTRWTSSFRCSKDDILSWAKQTHSDRSNIYVYYIRRSSMRYNKSQTDTLTNIRTAFTYCRKRKTHGQINKLLEQFGSEVRSGLDNHRRWSLVHILTISICIPARHRGT